MEKQYKIIGLKKEDVHTLLGDPVGADDETNTEIYGIGTATVFNSFYEITYSADGIVSDAKVQVRLIYVYNLKQSV
ncbi:MAG: hypothetical protein KBT46_00490 [Ruminococcus sp.]|nr:hypothetical protein [Candidatus Copronaster equi]